MSVKMIGTKANINKGVTLIELMIALFIAAILVAGIYSMFISQQRSYSLQDQMVGIQQDARAALTIMSADIRMAGFLAGGEGFNVNSFGCAINPVNRNNGPDEITVVFGAEEISTVTNVSGSQVTLQSGGNKFDTGNKKYVAFEGVNHVYEITGISGDILTLNESLPSYLDGFGARVFLVKALTYKVQNSGLVRHENIGGGAQELAGGGSYPIAEDLQFAYQVEGDNSWYNGGALPAGKTNADIRMVRMNIVVRTPIEDLEDTNYYRPALEDRAASGSADGYRRRVYTTAVKVRNMGD